MGTLHTGPSPDKAPICAAGDTDQYEQHVQDVSASPPAQTGLLLVPSHEKRTIKSDRKQLCIAKMLQDPSQTPSPPRRRQTNGTPPHTPVLYPKEINPHPNSQQCE